MIPNILPPQATGSVEFWSQGQDPKSFFSKPTLILMAKKLSLVGPGAWRLQRGPWAAAGPPFTALTNAQAWPVGSAGSDSAGPTTYWAPALGEARSWEQSEQLDLGGPCPKVWACQANKRRRQGSSLDPGKSQGDADVGGRMGCWWEEEGGISSATNGLRAPS